MAFIKAESPLLENGFRELAFKFNLRNIQKAVNQKHVSIFLYLLHKRE